MNLAALLDEQATRFGDRVLATFEDAEVTYAGLADGAARFAGGLRELGIAEGDRVAVMMPNRAEFLDAWFGILKLAAIEVPLHSAARGPGIAHILETTGARAIVVDGELLAHVEPYLGELEHVVVVGPGRGELMQGATPAETIDVESRRPASILFTGGTTGPPKGVVLPHGHNVNVARGTVETVRYTESDVLFTMFPLFHANAKYTTVVAALIAGARTVINQRFSASRFWDICRREGVTAFNGQGEMLRILLKQPEREDDADNPVRVVFGAAAQSELVLEFEQRFGLSTSTA